MEPEQFLGSCLNCEHKCTDKIKDHKGSHLRHERDQFQVKVKVLNSAANSKQKEAKINNFFSDFFKQMEMVKNQSLQNIPQSFIECLSKNIGVPITNPSIIQKAVNQNYSALTCADIARIDMLMKNNVSQTDHQRFIAYFINNIRCSLMGVFDELAVRYSGNILPLSPPNRPPVVPPPISSNTRYNQPVRIEPPNIKPQVSQQSHNTRNAQRQRGQESQNRQQKNKNPRDIRKQNNRGMRRQPKVPTQPLMKKDEIIPDFVLINQATNKHGKFTIKVKVLEFSFIPDDRNKVKIRDQSGKGTLIISSKKKIVPNQTIIVTQCNIGYYKNQKQIRANSQSEVYIADEELIFNEKSESVHESETSSNLHRQDGRRRTRGGRERGQRRGNRGRGGGRDEYQKNRTQLTKIADIEPGQVNYHLVVKIIKIHSIENGIIYCTVGQSSGTANAQFPESWNYIKQGESLVLYGIQSSVINEHIVLTTVEEEYQTEQQIVRVSRCAIATHKIQSVNLQNNISLKQWVEQ